MKIDCILRTVDLSIAKPYTNRRLSLRSFDLCMVCLCADQQAKRYSRFSHGVFDNTVLTGIHTCTSRILIGIPRSSYSCSCSHLLKIASTMYYSTTTGTAVMVPNWRVNHDPGTPLGSMIVTNDHCMTCMHDPTAQTRPWGCICTISQPYDELQSLL